MQCAESIINQKGWDFDKLLKWVKFTVKEYIMKKMMF